MRAILGSIIRIFGGPLNPLPRFVLPFAVIKEAFNPVRTPATFLRIFDLFLLISPRPLKEDAMVRSRFLSVEAGLALLASIAHVQASDILPRETPECVRHVYLHNYQCINNF